MLPFIPIAIAVASGAGIFSSMSNNAKANRITMQSAREIQVATQKVQAIKDMATAKIEKFAKRKASIYSLEINDFVTVFSQLANCKVLEQTSHSSIFEELPSIPDIQKNIALSNTILKGIATGAGSGALLAYGTYSAVGLLANASTGTAISVLSGAAAKNATLAWLGGGSLSSGGAGIAGGLQVLGFMITLPAVAITVGLMLVNSRKNVEKALSNAQEGEKYIIECNEIIERLSIVDEIFHHFTMKAIKLSKKVKQATDQLKEIISKKGNDFKNYSEQDKNEVIKIVTLVKVLSAILNTSILTEEGTVTEDAAKKLSNFEKIDA